MGHFPAPFGNEIRIGILEALLAFAFSFIMLLSLLAGMKHIFHDVESTKVNHYFVMINLLFSSLLALIYTNDLFTAYVFVEINTIASCAIVMLKDNKGTLVAATRYLFMSLLGSGLFLIGITILYDVTGHLLMSNIQSSVAALMESGQYHLALEVVLALFCVGLATKSALFPFHSWLPDAHGSSTTSSSAILSGLVLKGYIIILIKIIYRVIGFEYVSQMRGKDILFVLGLAAMIMGSVMALREKDIKRMIAYSSVAQIGYIYMGIGAGSELAMAAACLHILVHAITKTMMFCAAGGFMEVSGDGQKFWQIRGAGRRNVLAGIAFCVGSFSLIGIPGLAGFTSKILFITSALELSSPRMIAMLICLAISTVLNALYYFPTMQLVFARTDDKLTFVPDRKDYGFIFAMIVFIVLNFAVGIGSGRLITLIEQGLQMFA
jgi:multicomponent Na+:H+ antiporter subunit D